MLELTLQLQHIQQAVADFWKMGSNDFAGLFVRKPFSQTEQQEDWPKHPSGKCHRTSARQHPENNGSSGNTKAADMFQKKENKGATYNSPNGSQNSSRQSIQVVSPNEFIQFLDE